jgi:hypothetical protein
VVDASDLRGPVRNRQGPRRDWTLDYCVRGARGVSGHTYTTLRKGAEMGQDNAQYELVRERSIVQEDPGIIVISVESILHRAHGVHGVLDVLVAREHNERRIFALALWRARRRYVGVYFGSMAICRGIRGAFKGKYEG